MFNNYISQKIMATNSNSLQNQLFENIKNLIPSQASFPDEMADLLGVSKDSAYRRLRGETALTIDEVNKLCTHYKISFDALGHNLSSTVSFDYNSLLLNEDGFKEYLTSIYKTLSRLTKLENKQVYYFAEDVPLFHHFKYLELSTFKMFYWLKSVMNVPSMEGKKFNPGIISDELIELGKNVYETYSKIPSVEIWTESTVFSTLKQIEYCWDSGQFFSKKDAIVVCEKLIVTLEDIQRQAELSYKNINAGCKADTGSYMLYNCEIEIGNNCILVKAGETKMVYITHMTFNKLITPHKAFCNDTEEWMHNLIKKSVLISGSSEKLRYKFFNKALASVKKLIKSIEGSD